MKVKITPNRTYEANHAHRVLSQVGAALIAYGPAVDSEIVTTLTQQQYDHWQRVGFMHKIEIVASEGAD